MKYNISAAMSITLLTFCLWSICIITEVSSLMCYECNTLYDPDCGNINKDSKLSFHYKYCTARNANYVEEYQKPLCRKIDQRIKVRGGMRVIKRGCGYELFQKREDDICYQIRNEDHEETVCQCFEDGCNSANTKISKLHYLNLVCSFLFIIWYFR